MNVKDLKSYFNASWELYEMLFSAVKSDETLFQSPDPLRNPLIFYLGHTAAFYINKLKMAGLIKQGVHDDWDQLFAVGVDPNLPENLDVADTWPTAKEVRSYREEVFNIVHSAIEKAPLDLPASPDSPLWSLLMGLEHDRIHFETSSVLIRQLEANLVECPSGWDYAPTLGNPPENEWIGMAGGKVRIGKPHNSTIFGWDNEYGKLEVKVRPFKATKNLVTNMEFWDFVQTGGYEDRSLWTNEGWGWKERTKTSLPKFWVAQNGTFLYRAMFDLMPMPMDWPVEVNAHEAKAYCQWKNDRARLLSEAEFNLIGMENRPEGYDPLFTNDYNLDFIFGSPTPVGYMKNGQTTSGFNDIYGNVWDWLSDDFYPLPGFKAHPFYRDFSAPFMDDEHGMMGGGSWATTGTGASRYYRLWFRRHFFQHAGFRMAMDL